ncbi:MAG TPA: alpha/beta hydrolase domain-containing protein [Phenylobacterium sp.]
MSADTPTPIADVSGPIVAGCGWAFGAPIGDLGARGYVMEEFILAGTAWRYRHAADRVGGADGVWEAERAEPAPYRKRIYVVRPADAADFNGVLLLHWLNVSAGMDLGFPSDEETFRGYAWAGVSAQKIGLDGFPGLTKGLKAWDPDRYGSLHHPGDAYSYDIFAQAARLLRDGPTSDGPDPLDGVRPSTVVATGVSQSAIRLATYVNTAHPHDAIFDGFYLTVHVGMCAPLDEITLQEQMAPAADGGFVASCRIHDRGDVPILVLTTEFEALYNHAAPQPDTDTYRHWQIAGGAHVHAKLSAEGRKIFRRDGVQFFLQPSDLNAVDWSYVGDGGLRWIVRWAREGKAPPRFPPIEIVAAADGRPVLSRGPGGNVNGGIRLPEVAAATGVHLGAGKLPWLAGTGGVSQLFDAAEMARLHGDRRTFLSKWDAAVDDLVAVDLALPGEGAVLKVRGRALWP